MIQPLKMNFNTNFKGSKLSPALQKMAEQNNALKTMNSNIPTENKQEEQKPKVGFFKKIKSAFINMLKAFNTTSGVGMGIAKGIGYGAITTGAVGIIGKSIATAKKEEGLKVLTSIVINTIKDTAKVAKTGAKYIWNFFTEDKSILKHIGDLAKAPKKFYTSYLKGHKAVAAGATIIGASVVAFNTIKGKIQANQNNADVDHKYNHGHVK